ncbi:DNA topoisomerase 3-alpha isoform X2 [Nematostella vectensis]|uniref:DNA topoisomerase 3-alpha isoform X2 n=1 Tax=Nematostella vectensis TaxID=45351 RepID=UPI002076FACB|nr:DNA topoisomerase 3-alpha isoform X2 [Nematostella vectensis]
MRVLNVAEKNDAAKELSRIMSRGQCTRREGQSRFNKIYEFNFNILNANARMVMTSVSGHLMSLEFAIAYRKWSSCSPLSLFDAPVVKNVGEDYLPIKKTLECEVRGSQALIIWTDCDREGENIGHEIIDVCTKVCPRIKVYRARFSEITPQSVQRACANLVAPDRLQSEAVDVRMELDLRIGAAFTRFQTLRLQKVFPGFLSDQLISYGSCQFPTLGFVVERYKQVQQFVPEQFFKIKVSHETPDGQVDFVWKRGRLFHRLPCLILYQMCLESPTAKVLSTSSRPKSKWRPLPLDTVELEKLASRKLHINAKETMKIAEKLYTQGFISYPRTETNMFPSSLNLAELVEKQVQDANWGGFASDVLANGPNPRQGSKTDNAHPPIHPTQYTNNLQGNDKRLYEFIVRHFLACCSQDAQGRETSVEIDIAGEKFTATGLMITARNYLDVYPYDRWSTKVIPVYETNEEFQPTSIEMVDGETTPPPLLTEADLIALMEKHGIGTDATHADHIETIKSRSYVGVQGDGTFLPGQLGMGLVEGYDLMHFEFSKPKLRSGLEADLKRICDGTKSGAVVLREQIAKYKENFIQAAQEAIKLDQALSNYFGDPADFIEQELDPLAADPIVRPCPRCEQHQMTLRKTKEGSYMIGCQGFPQCRASIFLPKSVLALTVDESVCPVCRPRDVHMLRFTFKRGSVPPMTPLQYVGCIGGCDEMLTETLDIKDISRVVQNNRQMQQVRGNTRGSQPSRGQSRGRSQSSQFGASQTSASGRGRGRGTRTTGSNQSSRFNASQTSPLTDGFSGNVSWGQNTNRFGSSQTNSSSSAGNLSTTVDSGMFSPNGMSSFNSNNNDENAIVCTCGNAAIQLTVRKDGPNQGRQFYKCSQREGGCDFFLWADANGPLPSTPRPTLWSSTNGSSSWNDSGFGGSGGNSQSIGDELVCNCRQPAVSRTVNKDGPNKGRPFYSCSKPIGQSCGFFKWADQDEDGTGRGMSRGGSRGGTGGAARGGAGGGGRKRKRCGNCHQEGHTKRTCPVNR